MVLTDEEIKEILNNADILNIKLNPVKVLLSIYQNQGITQFNIEKYTDLRQPEVSLAIKNLSSKGFLECFSQREGGKGRPVKHYRLKKPITDYFDAIKKEKENEYLLSKLLIDEIIGQFKEE